MGVARDVRILEDGTTFSGRADSYITAAEGYDGGKPGGNCRIVRNHGTNREEEMSPKQKLLTLEAGETVRMETPGGGGLGDPGTREIDELARDLEDGRMLEATARQDYGNEMVDRALALSN